VPVPLDETGHAKPACQEWLLAVLSLTLRARPLTARRIRGLSLNGLLVREAALLAEAALGAAVPWP